MRSVEVTWIDSNIYRGWTTNEKLDDQLDKSSLECRTVGYVFRDDEDELTLVMSKAYQYRDDEEAASHAEMLTIPRVAVTNVRELE